jgi:flagellin-specific chaperone FliS
LRNNLDINREIIEQHLDMNFEAYISKCIDFLEALAPNYNILDGLGEVLDSKKKQEIKSSLVKETIFLLHSLK